MISYYLNLTFIAYFLKSTSMEYLELLKNKTKVVNLIFCLGALGSLMNRENSLEFDALHAKDLCR